MKAKENIVANDNKRIMFRSPPPKIKVESKKVDQTKEEAAFMKYLGMDFGFDDMSDAKRLASQGSIRSMGTRSVSVPPPSTIAD